MDSLNDWYRYLDRVSRPVRRGEETSGDTEQEWRPWLPDAGEAVIEDAVQPEAMPDLTLALGSSSPASGFQPAVVSFVDPALDDRLEPPSSFSVPRLQPPTFEVSIPRFGRQVAGTGDARAPAAEPAPVVERADAASRPDRDLEESQDEEWSSLIQRVVDPSSDSSRAPRHWDLLFQIRSRDVAQNSYKSRFRETREELVQRLLDPSLTLEETARLLGVCPTTVRRYTNRGHLRHFRTSGNQRRFRLSDVLEFLENRASEIEADARADEEAGTTMDVESGLDD